ncbi:O-antigen ligase family protein [Aeromicrobium wangtongii]|uniref:O-antigen ligase family protein n=1 Tax=Aeromicrobium wangtongii TaxID=2969247 RepID=UPI0020173BB5|nr:O-antigen ligase family protein [Aeromicrobium wangtongii]MCL3817234.1 O-antigen ligase family protein [Aeromicrobium wangtongii]
MDITIATIGTFVLSVQKLVAILVLPFGAAILRRLHLSSDLTVFLGLMTLTFCVGPLLGGYESESLTNSLVSLFLNFSAATIVYSALLETNEPVRVIGRVWVCAAVATSILAVGQSAGVVPLFAVTSDNLQYQEVVAGVQRASGLKEDANFAAMMLVIGLIFARSTPNASRRFLSTCAILAGITATLSRMGIIVAILVMVATAGAPKASSRSLSQRTLSRLFTAAAVAAAGLVAFALSSGNLRHYLDERTRDLRVAFHQIVSGQTADGPVSSGAERAALFRGTATIIRDKFATGVGPGNVPQALYEEVGLYKPAHNTYLETVAIGGIFGALAILGFFAIVMLRLRRGSWPSTLPKTGISEVRLLCVCVGLMAAVLTLTYNAFLWIPLILATAMASASASEAGAGAKRAELRRASGRSGVDRTDGRVARKEATRDHRPPADRQMQINKD